MILIIDNYDSFTYNLNQQIQKLGYKTIIRLNDKISCREIDKLNPSKIVISPGPMRPENSGKTLEVVQKYYSRFPILGVCLGHQAIGQVFSSNVVKAKKVFHGKRSKIFHNNTCIFRGISSPFLAARYHSLVLDKVPEKFKLLAWTKDKTIMSIKHKRYPLYGIQFHPESFLTKQGDKLIKNFLSE